MNKEKRWILINRLIYTILSISSISYFILNRYLGLSFIGLAIDAGIGIIVVIQMSLSYLLRYYEYNYNGNKIAVYAGYRSYALYLNGKSVSSLDNVFFQSRVELNYINFDDGENFHNIKTEIVLVNKIDVYVDNNKLEPTKKM